MRATSHALLGLCLLASASTWAQEPATPDSNAPADATPASNERVPLPERSVSEAQALERRLDKREQQMLQAGSEQFLGLWLPANVGEPSGMVIVLPGDVENADDALVVGPLRRKFPDNGWQSLSLTLPDPDSDPLPLRDASPAPADASSPAPAEGDKQATTPAQAPTETKADTPPAEPNPEARRDAHAERVMARIDAAIEFAKQKDSVHIVLLGHGSGAYWAIRYLNERKPASVHNLLMVAPAVPAGFGPPLDELVTQLPVAAGDFYYRDQLEDRNAALKRLQASKRAKLPTYIQVAMKALPGNRAVEQEQLYRRLRGWLKQHLSKG